MDRIERAFSWVRTITAGILVVSFGTIEEAIAQDTRNRGAWSLLLTFVIASVLFRIIEKITEIAVDNTAAIRRLIAGRHFVEGYWKDIVSDENGRPLFSGIVLIYYEDGRVRVSGRNFDFQGRPVGSFRATATEYVDGEIRFMFQYERERGESGVGNSSFIFDMRGSAPVSFRGEFFDALYKDKFKVYGEKVVDKRELDECTKLDGNPGLIAQYYFQTNRVGEGVGRKVEARH